MIETIIPAFKYGFQNVKMQDLMNLTGLSRGGIYHHYKNVDDAFRQIIHYYDEKTLALVNQGLSFEELLISLIHHPVGDINQALFEFYPRLNPEEKETRSKTLMDAIQTNYKLNESQIHMIIDILNGYLLSEAKTNEADILKLLVWISKNDNYSSLIKGV